MAGAALRRPGRGEAAATIEDPDIGLGVNTFFTPSRELCSVRCTEGDALRCGGSVGSWCCRHRAGNFIVSIMRHAHSPPEHSLANYDISRLVALNTP